METHKLEVRKYIFAFFLQQGFHFLFVFLFIQIISEQEKYKLWILLR